MCERKIWIDSPDGLDHTLWRYMDFLKFVDLLQRRSLWFTRLDNLTDLQEGAVTKPNAQFFAEVGCRTGFRGGIPPEALRKVLCVNCWNMSDYESEGMWKEYAGRSGVAIRSRITRLARSFAPDVTGGSWGIRGDGVSYVDYERDRLAGLGEDGSVQAIPAFLCKGKNFDHEREYRLATILEPHEYEQIGKHIPISLEELIERVVVSPNAPQWVAEVVRKEVRVHGVDVNVVASELCGSVLK